MKKTVFTLCSVLTVCAVIIMSCEKKEDPGMHKVYYNTQTGYSTGGNPNPNGVATSGGSATTTGTSTTGTSTTGTSCTASLSGFTTVTASGSGNNILINSSSPDAPILITFAGTTAPTSGVYSIVTGSPSGSQCTFQDASGLAAGGSVTVTTGSPNKVTFSGVVCGANTYTGTGCY